MSSEVGSGHVAIFPTFKGFRSRVSAEVGGATKAAGQAAGKGFSAAFDAGSGKVGDAAAKSLQRNVATASGALSKARLVEQDAAGKVRVAETQLAEARSKGEAGSARVVAAEERLASAQRKLTEATGKTKTASDQLKDAQSKLKDVTDSTAASGEKAAGRYSKGWSNIKGQISGDLKKAVEGAGNEAAQSAATSGQKAGSKFAGGVKSGLSGLANLGGMAAGAFLAAGAVVTGIAIKGGISRALAIEDAKASLDGLGHSAETVTGIMANASASVKGTAFGLGEAASTAAGAVAAGIKPGEKLERVLKLVADSATIAKTDMASMGSIFNKVAASGKLQGDVIAQLQDAGVPVLQFVAQEIGKTAEETAKLASDGKIDFETFSNAMEKGLGGAALKSGNTFRGAMKNTFAALGRIGETAMLPILAVVKDVFNAAMPLLDSFNAKLKPIMERFGTWLTGVAPAAIAGFVGGLSLIGQGLSGIKSLIVDGDFTGAFRAAFNVEEDAPIVGTLLRLRDTLGGVVGEIRGGLTAMVQAFKDGGTDVTSSGFAGILESVGLAARNIVDAFGPVAAQIGPAVLSVVAAFSPLGVILAALAPVLPELAAAGASLAAALSGALAGALQVIAPILSGILTFTAGLVSGFMQMDGAAAALAAGITTLVVGVTAYKLIIGTIAAAIKAWTAVELILKAVLAVHPIYLIIAGIALLIAGVVLLVKNWSKVAGFFSGIWEKIKAGASAFIGFLKDVFLKFHPLGIIISNWGAITGFFAGLWSNIVDGAKVLGAGFLDFFKSLPGMLLDGLKAVGMAILQGLALGIALTVVGIKFAFTEMPGLIVGWLFDAGTWLLQTGINLMNGLVSGVQAAWAAVVLFFTELPGKILAFLVSAGTWLLATGTSILQGLWGGITAGYQAVAAFFTALPGQILAFLASAGTWLINTGRTLLDGLLNGINTGYTAVVSFFTSLPGKVTAFLAASGTWLVGAGRNTINGLRDGLVQTWGNVTGWLAGIPGAITGAVSGAGQWLYSAGQNVVQGLLNGIRSLAGSIGNFFLDLLPGWIVGPFKAALGIHSPSRVFAGFGENIGEGVMLGVGRTEKRIDRQMRSLVSVPPVPRLAVAGAGTGAAASAGSSASAGTGVQVTVQGNVGWSATELADQLDTRIRRGVNLNNLRRGALV